MFTTAVTRKQKVNNQKTLSLYAKRVTLQSEHVRFNQLNQPMD